MLHRLTIQDFALIDQMNLEFSPGLNIFTGETGAGKSIILDALSLILGDRASHDMIRSDSEQAYVEAVFEISDDPGITACLHDHGLKEDADGLIISREVSRSGKNRCFVNGRQTVLACLKELGVRLVDIHGQHAHQRLLDVGNHLQVLDSFGDDGFQEFRAGLVSGIGELKDLQARLRSLERSGDERRRELEIVRFQVGEIDEAGLLEGEDEQLEKDWKLLSRSGEIRENLSSMVEDLSGDDGPRFLRALARFADQLEAVAGDDTRLEGAAKNTREAYFLLEDVRSEADHFLRDFDARPERLQDVEDRLGEINKLKRKYGSTCAEILERRQELQNRLDSYEGHDAEKSELDRRATDLRNRLEKELPLLSAQRQTVADSLRDRVTRELGDLAMKGARFEVRLNREPVPVGGEVTLEGQDYRLFREGLERAQFFVSTNPGEPMLPLVKVASGGELSRITLALKSSLANLEAVPIMVFDEIDAGIGGQTATNVATKLVQVAHRCQCLCITHLPQIASRGQTHFLVKKKSRSARTVVAVDRLQGKARTREISRMLGGKSNVSLELAEEMLSRQVSED